MRGVRMQLELMKPELLLDEQGVNSTIVIFGSARILSAEAAQALLTVAEDQRRRSRRAHRTPPAGHEPLLRGGPPLRADRHRHLR